MRGRPSTYTEEIAAEILERLAAGESLRAICRDDHMPIASTVRGWVVDNRNGFSEQYARARDIGLDEESERMLEIADTEPDPARARVMVDVRKWYLSKMAPKRYGDKLTTEVSGPGGGAVPVSVTVELVRASPSAGTGEA